MKKSKTNAVPQHPYIAATKSVKLNEIISVPTLAIIMEHWHPVNRMMNKVQLETIRRDVENNKWDADSGNDIKFDSNGHLIDGQKRVKAHLLAGVPMKTDVKFGLPPEAILRQDTVQLRTDGDNVTLEAALNNGCVQPEITAFQANRRDYSMAANCLNVLHGKRVWSASEKATFLKKNHNSIRFALEGSNGRRLGALAVLALYHIEHPTQAVKFRKQFWNEQDQLAAGQPARTLYTYLHHRSSPGGSAPIWDGFNAIRCINAFHNEESITASSLSNDKVTVKW